MILERLKEIVGEDYATDDDAICTSYSRDQHFHFVPKKKPAFVVKPGDREEVREILIFANENRIPIVPWSTGINVRGLTIPEFQGSILLDLSRLNKIEINEEMMTATVGPGVTFALLTEEAKKYNLRAAYPDAPLTAGVLTNNYLRGIYQTSVIDGHDHLLSFEMIIPNGEIIQTGSRALNRDLPYFRYGLGPDMAGLMSASPGTWGVVTELTLKLYKLYEKRSSYFIGFEDIEESIDLVGKVAREELVSSCRLVDNQSWLIGMCGSFEFEYDKLPNFVVCLLIDGLNGIFQAKDKIVRELIEDSGGRLLNIPESFKDNFERETLGGTERSCMVFGIRGNYHCIGLYGPLKYVPEYYELHRKTAREVGIPEDYVYFYVNPIARFHGQLCYVELDIFYDGSDFDLAEKLKEYNKRQMKNLLDAGIYGWFRPYAGIIEPSIERAGYLTELWKRFNDVVDPKHIMNPGKLW